MRLQQEIIQYISGIDLRYHTFAFKTGAAQIINVPARASQSVIQLRFLLAVSDVVLVDLVPL